MPRLSDFHRAAEKRRTNGRAGQRIQLYWQHFKIIQDRFARIMGYRMGGEQRRRIPFDESSSVECVPLVDNGSWAAGRPCFAKSGDSDFSISPRGPRVTKKGINVSTLPGKPIDTTVPEKISSCLPSLLFQLAISIRFETGLENTHIYVLIY